MEAKKLVCDQPWLKSQTLTQTEPKESQAPAQGKSLGGVVGNALPHSKTLCKSWKREPRSASFEGKYGKEKELRSSWPDPSLLNSNTHGQAAGGGKKKLRQKFSSKAHIHPRVLCNPHSLLAAGENQNSPP